MTRLWTVAAAVLLCVGAPAGSGVASGQEAAPDPLRRGIEFVEEGDFEAAAEVLEAVAINLEGRVSRLPDLARVYLYLGIARLYSVGEDDARRAFRQAQERNPRLHPAEANASRRVLRLWEEARTIDADPPSSPDPPPVTAADPGVWLAEAGDGFRLRVALGLPRTHCLGELSVERTTSSIVWTPDPGSADCANGLRRAFDEVESVTAAAEGGFELRLDPWGAERFVFIPEPFQAWFENGTTRLRHFDLSPAQRVATRVALRRLLAEVGRSASSSWSFYGTPVDAPPEALLDTPAGYDARAVRTRGRFSILRNGRDRLHTLAVGERVINLAATPEQRARLQAHANDLDGEDIEVTGIFRRLTGTERRALRRRMMSRRFLVEAVALPEYEITLWDFSAETLPQEHLPQRRLLDIVTAVPLPLDLPLDVVGQFRGSNLYGDLPAETRRGDDDWVLRDGPVSMWVRDRPPRGDGWSLDPHSLADTATWLRVRGRIRDDGGSFHLRASHLVPVERRAGEPVASDDRVYSAERPDVQFTLPIEAEPAPPDSQFVIQFTRPMDVRTFGGRVLLQYAGSPRPDDPVFEFASFEYDRELRALHVDPGVALQPGREFEIVLQAGIRDASGMAFAGGRTLRWTVAQDGTETR